MLLKKENICRIFETLSEIRHHWKKHLSEDNNKDAGIYSALCLLATFIIGKIYSYPQDTYFLSRLFSLIELMLTDGDDDLKEALKTGFLEEILNIISQDASKSGAAFIDYLGPNTLKCCRENDEFWGTKTRGLYPKKEENPF